MSIRAYERKWRNPNGGENRRLVIDIPRHEIEEDDSPRPGSLHQVLTELHQVRDELDAAIKQVADGIGTSRALWRAAFVAQSLNILPTVIRDGKPTDDPPCCASECTPCAALVQLHERGLLSEWLRPYIVQSGDGWDWWTGDAETGAVDWEWISPRICYTPNECTAPGWCCSALDGTGER